MTHHKPLPIHLDHQRSPKGKLMRRLHPPVLLPNLLPSLSIQPTDQSLIFPICTKNQHPIRKHRAPPISMNRIITLMIAPPHLAIFQIQSRRPHMPEVRINHPLRNQRRWTRQTILPVPDPRLLRTRLKNLLIPHNLPRLRIHRHHPQLHLLLPHPRRHHDQPITHHRR